MSELDHNDHQPVRLTNHEVPGQACELLLEALGKPSFGNAHHVYRVRNVVQEPIKTEDNVTVFPHTYSDTIAFQHGPIKEFGVNGLTGEVLLAIVEHRLECFQSSQYACAENQEALDHVRSAMNALKSRTLKRMQRGVEGTHQT